MSVTVSLKRPASVPEMLERVGNLMSEASVGQAVAFQPDPSDVFIATYPKCGTTWLQQMVHTLRTRGDMDFREITEVVPWLELALDMKLDIHGPQRGKPRAYKTHLPWAMLPKGGRYINVFRDPGDVIVSQFHFWNGWFFEAGTVSIDDVAEHMFLDTRAPFSYWTHFTDFWPLRGRDDVLLLCFEQMKANPQSAVRQVADFLDCPLDAELLELTLRHTSVAFMREHVTQFDDHLFREARDAACGIPPGGGSAKVRKGSVGDSALELSAQTRDRLDAVWREQIGDRFGFDTYADLRAQFGD